MYDFLCVLPHGCASHSLTHYLNLHKDLHVAPYPSITHSQDDILAYERNFRPFITNIGIATKDYADGAFAESILAACTRRLLIQTVRDPVDSFVSLIRNNRSHRKLTELRGGSPPPEASIESFITEASTQFLTHGQAEMAYEASSFDTHILLDVVDLRGDKIHPNLESLWTAICGSARAEDISPCDEYISLGSKFVFDLRQFCGFFYEEGPLRIEIKPRPDGDLWQGTYYPKENRYDGWEEILHTFPDINAYLPSMGLSGPIHMCAYASQWAGVHTKLRPKVIENCIPLFETNMRWLDQAYRATDSITPFELDDLTTLQSEMLKASIHADVTAFGQRHPEIAGKWETTNALLNS